MSADVIVVGAGIAGLVCAERLTQIGMSVLLLEARARPGGRIRTLHLPGAAPIELGAQVIHGERGATWYLSQAAGLPIKPLEDGEVTFVLRTRSIRGSDLYAAGVDPPWVVEAQMASSARPDQTVSEALAASTYSAFAKLIAAEWIAQTWAADPAELSVAGIAMRRAAARDERQFVLIGGYDRLLQGLASRAVTYTGAPVDRIEWAPGAVRVHVRATTYRSRCVVICVPPSVVAAGRLRFEPGLPDDKLSAAKRLKLGDAITVVASHRQPAGESAWLFTVGDAAGFWRTDRGSGHVIGSIKGPAAVRARRLKVSEQLLVDSLGLALPWLSSNSLTAIRVTDWGAERWSGGAFSSPRFGALDAPGFWASPIDETLFFAGEATNQTMNPGLVDAAIDSGERAAKEVAGAMRG